jgi:hypothetical protein
LRRSFRIHGPLEALWIRSGNRGVSGNIYSFNSTANVFPSNGQLVAACGTSTPANIALTQLGNAIAQPVNVSIVVNSPSTQVSSGTFGAGFCQTDIDQFSCQLASSAGVAVSNNSVVEMSSYPVPPPLWTGTVVAKNGVNPAVGDDISLELTMACRQPDLYDRCFRRYESESLPINESMPLTRRKIKASYPARGDRSQACRHPVLPG